MKSQQCLAEPVREQAGYFPVPGGHLYTVLHEVAVPAARVLLVGPFAAERHTSYIPWVRWARHLASLGIEVLRYDHRGVGESFGAFEETSFQQWSEDITLLAHWMADRSPGIPLVLHGLEVGAVLAARAFHQGIGDVLLLWSPPKSVNDALRSTLLRWVGLAQLFKYGEERKTPAAYIREMQEGSSIEVDGYRWSGELWQESIGLELPLALEDDLGKDPSRARVVRVEKLGKQATPLIKGGVLGYDEGKDFTALFVDNSDWLRANLPKRERVVQ